MIDVKKMNVSRTLAKTAVSLWLVSLALPGFSVEYGAEPFYGIFILFLGILFGWGVSGWAAYANIFFILASFKMLKKPDSVPIGISIAMVVLAAMTPIFNGPIRDEGSGTIVPVVSWGWGAILWFLSIAFLAIATACRAKLVPKFNLKLVPIFLGALLITVGAYRMYQWGNASDQDREMYLPKSMAFSVADFCRVPLVWPTGPLVQADETVAIDIEASLRSDVAPYMPIKLPEFVRYERFGYDWEKFQFADMPSMTVRSSPEPKNIFLQVKRTTDGGVIKILNKSTNAVLYEQPLRLVTAKDGRMRVCPLSGSEQWSGLSRGHYDALKVALGPVIKPKSATVSSGNANDHKSQIKLLSELAKPCGNKRAYFDSQNAEQDLDGRRVVLGGDIRKLSTWCSPSYVGLVFVRSGPVGMTERLNSDVYLYDRKTLKPLASFQDRSGCLASGGCSGTVLLDNIEGLLIEDEKATVNTAEGVATSKRRF
jgi:hypothetical protein